MSDWGLEASIAADKRRGVIPQREKQLTKKKKIPKPWTVYWSVFFNRRSILSDLTLRLHPYRFATEAQAVNYAEKIHRSFYYPNRSVSAAEVWVVDDTELPAWRQAVIEESGEMNE